MEGAVKEKRFLLPGKPPPSRRRSAWTKGELQSLGGELRNWLMEGKSESNLQRRSVLLSYASQAEMLMCQWK